MRNAFLLFMALCALHLPARVRAEHKNDKMICSLLEAYRQKDRVAHLKNDKAKHCILSCLIAQECGGKETITLGVLKEVWDLLGYGNPEWEDLEADVRGIKIAYRPGRQDCFGECLKIYPSNK